MSCVLELKPWICRKCAFFSDWYHTRIVKYYRELAIVMPIYLSIFLFFTTATISFIGEFPILTGSLKCNISVTFLGAT